MLEETRIDLTFQPQMGQMVGKENLFTLRIRPGVYTGRRFVNNVSNLTPRNVRVSSKDILVFLYDGHSIFLPSHLSWKVLAPQPCEVAL